LNPTDPNVQASVTISALQQNKESDQYHSLGPALNNLPAIIAGRRDFQSPAAMKYAPATPRVPSRYVAADRAIVPLSNCDRQLPPTPARQTPPSLRLSLTSSRHPISQSKSALSLHELRYRTHAPATRGATRTRCI